MKLFERFRRKQELSRLLLFHVAAKVEFVCVDRGDMVENAWKYDSDFFDGYRLVETPHELSLLLYSCCIGYHYAQDHYSRRAFSGLAHDCVPVLLGQNGFKLNRADEYVLRKYKTIIGLS